MQCKISLTRSVISFSLQSPSLTT